MHLLCVCDVRRYHGSSHFPTHSTTCTSVAPSMRDVLVTIICLNYRWWITVHLQWKIRFLLVFYVCPFPLPINFDVVIFACCRAHSRWLGLERGRAAVAGNRHRFMADYQILVTCTWMDSLCLFAFFVVVVVLHSFSFTSSRSPSGYATSSFI